MHEVALIECVVAAVSERVGHARVKVVCVEIDASTGVVPAALRACFALYTRGTVLEGAELEIREISETDQDQGQDLYRVN